MRRLSRAVLAASVTLAIGVPARAQTLRGSIASVDTQYDVAVSNEFTFLESPRDVQRFVKLGLLVRFTGSAAYSLSGVSYPYARSAVRLFVERISQQYKAACGEKLVVTSLTRPESAQPRNASDDSVHPTGMAVDLRVSNNKKCRAWLEQTLLSMERNRLIEATREKRPAHYHIAVFPERYTAYVESKVVRAP